MILTGKAKQDFEFWLRDYYEINRKDYNKYPFPVILKKYYRKTDIEINALIIEWFDSVGIYIGLVRFNVGSGYFEARIHYHGGIYFTSISRQEATTKAIEKANTIYNNL